LPSVLLPLDRFRYVNSATSIPLDQFRWVNDTKVYAKMPVATLP
jgi:hypothetical protein